MKLSQTQILYISLAICLVLMVGVMGVMVWIGNQLIQPAELSVALISPSPTSSTTPTSTPTAQSASPTKSTVTATPVASKPLSIQIPAIKVAASMEAVGLDSNKNMGVPQNAKNVALYNLGAKPGEKGNVVISGHLDSTKGAAVFYKLGSLKVGDKIIVTDDKSRSFTYAVTDKQSFPYDKFPLQAIFGATTKEQLNLITCAGKYNKATQNYSERLVVIAELNK